MGCTVNNCILHISKAHKNCTFKGNRITLTYVRTASIFNVILLQTFSGIIFRRAQFYSSKRHAVFLFHLPCKYETSNAQFENTFLIKGRVASIRHFANNFAKTWWIQYVKLTRRHIIFFSSRCSLYLTCRDKWKHQLTLPIQTGDRIRSFTMQNHLGSKQLFSINYYYYRIIANTAE